MAKEQIIFVPPTEIGDEWLIKTSEGKTLGSGAILRWAIRDAVLSEIPSGRSEQKRLWGQINDAWRKASERLRSTTDRQIGQELQRLKLDDTIQVIWVQDDPSGLPRVYLGSEYHTSAPARSDLLASVLSTISVKGRDLYTAVFSKTEQVAELGKYISWPPAYEAERIGFGTDQALDSEMPMYYVYLAPKNDGTVRAVGDEFDLICNYGALMDGLRKVDQGDWKGLLKALHAATV